MKSQLLIVSAVFALVAAPVMAAEHGGTAMQEHEGTAMDSEAMGEAMEAAPEVVDNKICPISGNKIGSMGEPVTVEYMGKQYKLCCPACKKDFMKDPDAAVKKIEESMMVDAAAEPMMAE